MTCWQQWPKLMRLWLTTTEAPAAYAACAPLDCCVQPPGGWPAPLLTERACFLPALLPALTCWLFCSSCLHISFCLAFAHPFNLLTRACRMQGGPSLRGSCHTCGSTKHHSLKAAASKGGKWTAEKIGSLEHMDSAGLRMQCRLSGAPLPWCINAMPIHEESMAGRQCGRCRGGDARMKAKKIKPG